MAWATLRTFREAASTVRQAIVGTTATAGEDVPLYNSVYGLDGADPTRVSISSGLPTQPQRTTGAPVTGAPFTNAVASATTVGNSTSLSPATAGIYVITALDENSAIIMLGDSSTNAAARAAGGTWYARGIPLQPGESYVVATNNLSTWRLAVRIANDGVSITKVGD